MSYRQSHQHKGGDYHSSFQDIPRRRMMWALERGVLRRIMARELDERRVRYLDFACGTGRVLGFLEDAVAEATGIDISASMLADARTRVRRATLHHGDITREDPLGGARYDLITAFRFFPNAEPSLRDEVMAALVHHLEDDGLLVFNNHQNDTSTARRILRLMGKTPELTMTQGEVDELVQTHGLQIVARYPLGVLPFTDRRMLRPTVLVRGVEWALSHVERLGPWADTVVFVCRRRQRGAA